MNKEVQEIVGSGKPTGSVRKKTISFSVTIPISVQNRHSRILFRALLRGRLRSRSPRGKSPSGKMSRLPCKDCFKGTCTNSFCEKWHPPECLFYKSENGCRFGEKCSYVHRQVEEQPTKRSKKNGDKSAVAMLKRNRATCYECLLIKYTTIGLRIPGNGAVEVFIDFTEELRHTGTDPMCKIHKSRCSE